MKQKVQFHTDALLNSYSQVFFSLNKILALLIMLTTFLKPAVGLIAITSVVFANSLVYIMGYQLKAIREGMYGFNVLLLAVALSNLFQINTAFLVLMLVSTILVTTITISMSHLFERHLLPSVSIPFFAAFWIVKLATPNFNGLFLNLDDVYWLNSTYRIGGEKLVDFYIYFDTLSIPIFLQIFFKSLGSVFFIPHVISGVIISIGILLFSRIAFTLSVLAFYVAWKGCLVFGYNQENLIAGLTGSNIIFTAIGIGCFYLVPNIATYLLALLLVPITLLLCNTFNAILAPWGLPAMTMPFAFITVLTLHALRMRLVPYFFKFVDIQYYSPEKVVYKFQNLQERFSNVFPIKFQLPVMGKWFISQGYEGEITHKGAYDKAIDFVITEDVTEKTFYKDGINLEDYYCYSKPVLAPAEGYVSNIVDYIEDNQIKNVNLEKNWGNSIVIYHADGFYSQLSHLKCESVKVQVGDYVKAGDIIALCGSSGRSPEPHLHYQIQQVASIGGSTITYPFAYYLEHLEGKVVFKSYEVPKKDARVENILHNKMLGSAFYFIPGKKLKFLSHTASLEEKIESWEVFTDSFNRSFIYCHLTGSVAYFVNDGTVFYFTDFEGDKESLLFYFYVGCYKILLAYYQDLEVEDLIPSDVFHYKLLQPFQDIVAPFFNFIKANYHLRYSFIDDIYNCNRIELKSRIETHTRSRIWREINFDIVIADGKISSITCTSSSETIHDSNMHRITLLFSIFLLSQVQAQTTVSSDIIEAKLIYFTGIAEDDSVHYYSRLAEKNKLFTNQGYIAVGDYYLSKKNYAKALQYYDEALTNNHYNPLLHYNMNICYSYLGMYDHQHYLSRFYNDKQIEYYQYRKNKLEYISFFAGTLASNNLTKNANIDLTNGSKFFGTVDRTGSLYYNYFSTQYRFKSRFTLFGSVNYNTIFGNQQFNYEYFKSTPPKQVDTAYITKTNDYKVIQPIGYLQLAYISHKNIKLKLSYGLTNTSYTLLNPTPEQVHQDTFPIKKTSNTECTVGLMIQYRQPRYQVDLRWFIMPFSKLALLPIPSLSDSDRTQADVAFTYFPLRKNTLSIKVQSSICNTQNSYAKWIFTGEVNTQLLKNLWMSLQYQGNNLKNFIDLEGSVVYNIDDDIKSKIATRFTYYVNRHLELSLQYGYMKRVGTYDSLEGAGKLVKTTEYKYSNQIINGGIKWNL